jgi:Trp operon repressor
MADTIGSLIDKLTIVNLKIFKSEDKKRDINATDAEVANCTRATNTLNSQRNDLIQEIDEKLNHMVETGELQKLYQQGTLKSYGTK